MAAQGEGARDRNQTTKQGLKEAEEVGGDNQETVPQGWLLSCSGTTRLFP